MSPLAAPTPSKDRSQADTLPADVYRLGAMEVWGGNTARREHVLVPGLDAAIFCHPFEGASEGGDLHFLSTCAAGQISRFTIADVAGHGAAVGEFAARLRSIIRKNVNMPNPTRFAHVLNDEFAAMSREGIFATAIIITYFAPSDHLIVCNAGHPRPLLYREATKRWDLFDEKSQGLASVENVKAAGIGNLPLGLLEGTSYPLFATALERGDILVAYTDAMIETCDSSGRELGEQGLLDLVSSIPIGPTADMRDSILARLDRVRNGDTSPDDQTLLVVRHTAEDPPPMTISVRLKTLGRLVGLVSPGVGRGF